MPLFDLHSHFSFKPANSERAGSDDVPDIDHWRERFKDEEDYSHFIAWADRDVVKSSQLNGDAALVGGFGTILNGFYPLEQGFTHPAFNRELATLVGFATKELESIMERRASYMQHLQREYDNLRAGLALNGPDPAGKRYVLVNSYADWLAEQGKPQTICIINSVEGAHAFADNILDAAGQPMSVLGAERKHIRRAGGDGLGAFHGYIQGILANIDRVKRWQHTPLFVTLAHHYYNTLCGHSPSLTSAVAALVPQDGRTPHETGSRMVRYFDVGIRSWGYRVVARLLNNTDPNGQPVRRILIDTKHMSPQARWDYYTNVIDSRNAQGDEIPIVVSHTAVSGRASMKATIDGNNSPTGEFDLQPGDESASRYFYRGVINLFDDEIVRVVDSDGIMGLMIDERRIMGVELPPEAGLSMDRFQLVARQNRAEMARWTTTRNEHAWGRIDTAIYNTRITSIEASMTPLLDELRPAYLSVLFRQLFHIARITQGRGWDHVALGTDYDGVINPIDIYRQSRDMRTLRQDLITFWNDKSNDPDAAVRQLYNAHLYGRTREQVLDGFLSSNGEAFLRKYFHDGYLKDGLKG